jgi:hypothetical protein
MRYPGSDNPGNDVPAEDCNATWRTSINRGATCPPAEAIPMTCEEASRRGPTDVAWLDDGGIVAFLGGTDAMERGGVR